MHPDHVSDRLGNGQLVGLAVCWTKHGNMHAGIGFQWRDACYMYHQAFHFDTKVQLFTEATKDLGGATLTVAMHLGRDRQKAIAGFLNSIAKINPQFPYSLKYDPEAHIDESIGKLISNDGIGLSCVTFVLAIMQSCQIRLVDAASWPIDRPEDLLAHQRLIEALEKRKPKVSDEHMQAVRVENGCLRIRPEEVAAAGCYIVWPVEFSKAEPASMHLLKRLSNVLGMPAWRIYPETSW